jgi:hypothetical protein
MGGILFLITGIHLKEDNENVKKDNTQTHFNLILLYGLLIGLVVFPYPVFE